MDQSQIKFGIELPKELHRQVKIAVATRGLKMKEASEQAFTAWLESVNQTGEAPKTLRESAQVQAASPFGALTHDEEQYVHWLLALLRQKKPTPSAEIALQAVRLAGAKCLARRPLRRKENKKSADCCGWKRKM